MRSLVKLADYMLVERLIESLVETNRRLFELMFGVELPHEVAITLETSRRVQSTGPGTEAEARE